MRSFLFSLCIAGCIGLPSVVLSEPDPGHHPGRRGEMLQKELGLSDEQASQIREIFKSSFGKCRDVAEHSARKECREKNRDERQKQLAGVLSADQLKKFQELKEKRREEWKSRRGKGCDCSCDKDKAVKS